MVSVAVLMFVLLSNQVVWLRERKQDLTRSLPLCRAIGTKAADGHLPMDCLESPRHRNFRPGAGQIDVVNSAAAFAVKVAMLMHVRTKTHSGAVQVHLLGQPAFHQRVKAV